MLSPHSIIGIVGGGQLGRMLAMAAARLGLRCRVFCERADAPAFAVAESHIRAAYDDTAAIREFAQGCDVITFEFENVPAEMLTAAAALAPVLPRPAALETTQDRLAEKRFLESLSIPVAPYREVAGEAGLAAAVAGVGLPAMLKARRLGYDGKGQARIGEGDDPAAAHAALSGAPAILEGVVGFESEVSVIAARGSDGATAFYDLTHNRHENGILAESRVPAGLPRTREAEARRIAERIAAGLDYTGVLAVELFYCGEDAQTPLLVNEIAPRVHNSGHWTLDACAVSQFENHIRAVAGWPLGATQRHSDAVMTNLIGGDAEGWAELAADPDIALHLYGKREARAGRKMGHFTRLAVKSGPPR